MKGCKHKWADSNGPVSDPQPNDAFCSDCGKLYTGKGRPRKVKPVVAGDVLAAVAGEIAGSGPDVTSYPSEDGQEREMAQVNGVVEPLTIVKPPPTWCKMAGKRISQAYVMLIEGACARFAKRQTAEPEDEDVAELGNALGEQMAVWFPDSDMTPAAKIAIAAASVAATMVVGSKVIAPAPSATTQKQTDDVVREDETLVEFEPRKSSNVKLPSGLY